MQCTKLTINVFTKQEKYLEISPEQVQQSYSPATTNQALHLLEPTIIHQHLHLCIGWQFEHQTLQSNQPDLQILADHLFIILKSAFS